MEEKARRVGADTLVFERVLPGSLETVWDHLTKPELLSGWLARAEFEPRKGGAVRLHFGEKTEAGTITH